MASVSTIFGNFNEEQLKTLKDALNEMAQCMQKADTEKLIIKDIVDATYDNLKIPKKILKRMAVVHYKNTFSQQVVEDKEFEALYVGVTEVK